MLALRCGTYSSSGQIDLNCFNNGLRVGNLCRSPAWLQYLKILGGDEGVESVTN